MSFISISTTADGIVGKGTILEYADKSVVAPYSDAFTSLANDLLNMSDTTKDPNVVAADIQKQLNILRGLLLKGALNDSKSSNSYMTSVMAQTLDVLFRSFTAVGVSMDDPNQPSNPDYQVVVTANQAKAWGDFANFTPSLKSVLSSGVDMSNMNHSIQAMIELQYVKGANDILQQQLSKLEDALNVTKSALGSLTNLQDLHNNLTITAKAPFVFQSGNYPTSAAYNTAYKAAASAYFNAPITPAISPSILDGGSAFVVPTTPPDSDGKYYGISDPSLGQLSKVIDYTRSDTSGAVVAGNRFPAAISDSQTITNDANRYVDSPFMAIFNNNNDPTATLQVITTLASMKMTVEDFLFRGSNIITQPGGPLTASPAGVQRGDVLSTSSLNMLNQEVFLATRVELSTTNPTTGDNALPAKMDIIPANIDYPQSFLDQFGFKKKPVTITINYGLSTVHPSWEETLTTTYVTAIPPSALDAGINNYGDPPVQPKYFVNYTIDAYVRDASKTPTSSLPTNSATGQPFTFADYAYFANKYVKPANSDTKDAHHDVVYLTTAQQTADYNTPFIGAKLLEEVTKGSTIVVNTKNNSIGKLWETLGSCKSLVDAKNQLISMRGQLSAQMHSLSAITPRINSTKNNPNGDEDPNSLVGRLRLVYKNIQSSFGSFSAGDPLTGKVLSGFSNWLLDKYGKRTGADSLQAGVIQQNITTAIVAGQSLNDEQKAEVKRYLNIFEEYYKSATSILTKLSDMIERIAQQAARG